MSNGTANAQKNKDLEEATRTIRNEKKVQENPVLQGQENDQGNAKPDQTPPDLGDKKSGQTAAGDTPQIDPAVTDDPVQPAHEQSAMSQLNDLTNRLVAEGMPLHEASQVAREYIDKEDQLRLQEQQYLDQLARMQGRPSGRASFFQALLARNRFNSDIDKEILEAERKALNASIYDRIGSLRLQAWRNTYEQVSALQNDLADKVAHFNNLFEESEAGQDFRKHIKEVAPDENEERVLWKRVADPNDRSPEVEKARELLDRALSSPEVMAAYEDMHAVKDKMLKTAGEAAAIQEKAVVEFPDLFSQEMVDNMVKESPIQNDPERFRAVAETPEKINSNDTVFEKMQEMIDNFINKIAAMFGISRGPKNSA